MANKVIRKPREWTETCKHCRGSGRVFKRELFILQTPDEHQPVLPIDGYRGAETVPPNAYVCTVVGSGAVNIFDAVKEGVAIAELAGRPVAFEFNGTVAICFADSNPVTVAKDWWKLAFGKTYEQSLADR